MKIHRYLLIGLAAGISAFAVSSCAYDPYYSNSYGGYGDGYGHGHSSFSTSAFVSTGSSRWGYDPYAGSYYDFSRRAYYDPHLRGYYPVGYRPRYVSGSPHPHGWRRGSSFCPPPSSVRSYNLTNYRNRTDRYRNLGRNWSRNVRDVRHRDQRPQSKNNRDQRSGRFDGLGGRSNNRQYDYGKDWRNKSRDNRRNDGRRFQGRDDRSRDAQRNRGNATVKSPQQRPQGGVRTGSPASSRAALEKLVRQHRGGENRANRGGGDRGARSNNDNRSGSGGGSRQRTNSSRGGRERGGDRIRGIGEG